MAKLHRTPIVRSEGLFDTSEQAESHSVRSGQGQGQQATDHPAEPRDECNTPGRINCPESNSFTTVHAHGDASDRPSQYDQGKIAHSDGMFDRSTDSVENKSKSDGHVSDDKVHSAVGRKKKVQGMITEGLRTNSANMPTKSKKGNIIYFMIFHLFSKGFVEKIIFLHNVLRYMFLIV